jgi:hypothetical protein
LKPAEQPPHEIRENLSQWPEISLDANTDRSQQARYTVDQGQHLYTTNTFIEHMKSTKVDLGNNIFDKYREE